MNTRYEWLGNVVGLAGIALCAAAGLARVMGHFYLFGYASMTLFLAGAGLMIAAILIKVHGLTRRI